MQLFVSMSKSNLIKLVAALVVLFAIVGVLFWGPLLEGEPDPGPDIRTPSMENVPPSGTHLTIEINEEAEQE